MRSGFKQHGWFRFSLGLVMISELLSLASTLIILYLLNNDDAEDQEVRRRLGIVMSCIQSAGFFLIFFENIVNTINVLKVCCIRMLVHCDFCVVDCSKDH